MVSLVGKKVIVRTYSAGVHFGEVVDVSESGSVVQLKDTRRIWNWTGGRLSCSEVAMTGVREGDRVSVTVPFSQLNGAIEIIGASAASVETFAKVSPWTR